MKYLAYEVEINLEDLAGEIARSAGRLLGCGFTYTDVVDFVMHIDAMIGDLDFTKELHDALGKAIDMEEYEVTNDVPDYMR